MYVHLVFVQLRDWTLCGSDSVLGIEKVHEDCCTSVGRGRESAKTRSVNREKMLTADFGETCEEWA